jgi:LacI family sucrose operon transcriptional repressor
MIEKLNDEVLEDVSGGMTANLRAAYACINGDYGNGEDRVNALRRAGFDADGLPMRTANFDAQGGYRAMQDLLEKYPDLDSVICATDVIAHGAMKALREKGRRIPEDVRIAGIGNNWADLVSQPELTTVQLFQKRCGSEAARLLLKLIEREEAQDPEQDIREEPGNIMLGYRIIERGSV